MPSSVNDLLAALERGQQTTRDLRDTLQVSQPTVWRLLDQAGDQVVRIGRGRATRYALARRAFGAGARIPLYAVAGNGVISEIAILRPLGADGGYYLQGEDRPWWLLGETGTGVFDALPYFMEDARPQGFLGRHLAVHLARSEDLLPDPRRWNDEQLGTYLVEHGDDLPGNLLFGRRAMHAYRSAAPQPVQDRESDYPATMARVLGGEPAGSSAGGEQPKFTALTEHGHVIVKFSPLRDTQEGLRWADLLAAEYLAQQALAAQGIDCAKTELLAIDNRYYLEVRRFDRVGERGRQPSLSLATVEAEFVGGGEDWVSVAQRLYDQRRLDSGSLKTIIWAAAFGQWIGNTDMHLYNISVAPSDHGFTMLPLYDMTPMLFAPQRGELIDRRLTVPIRTQANVGVWRDAGQTALGFWDAVAADPRVSDGFRVLARRCSGLVRDALGH
ncbi:MAG TPA: type II toxin-antitoxin system HipA family toxin YjjJ [Gammaproteobacteria bacterium]|nr:type II toxin-antitoxin system HipA family toxin YjjJ [Gammaproteobacteria bacterium]